MSDFHIYSRQEWGAQPPKPGIGDLAYPVRKVFIHHEAGPVFPTFSTVDAEMAKMREVQANMMSREYSDFAYGVAQFPSGRVYEGRDLGWVGGGRDLMEGATIGENAVSIAIVFIGNYQIQNPTAQALAACAETIRLAQFAGRVTADAEILGHLQAPQASTACPGSMLYADLPQIRALVTRPAATPAPPPPPPKKEPEVVVLVPPAPRNKKENRAWRIGAPGAWRTIGHSETAASFRAQGIPVIEVTHLDDFDRLIK